MSEPEHVEKKPGLGMGGIVGIVMSALSLLPSVLNAFGVSTDGALAPFLPAVLEFLQVVAPFALFFGGTLFGWAIHRRKFEAERSEAGKRRDAAIAAAERERDEKVAAAEKERDEKVAAAEKERDEKVAAAEKERDEAAGRALAAESESARLSARLAGLEGEKAALEDEKQKFALARSQKLSEREREILKMLCEKDCVYVDRLEWKKVVDSKALPGLMGCTEPGDANRDVAQLLPNERARRVYDAAMLGTSMPLIADGDLMECAVARDECMQHPGRRAQWWWPCDDGRLLKEAALRRKAEEVRRAEADAKLRANPRPTGSTGPPPSGPVSM